MAQKGNSTPTIMAYPGLLIGRYRTPPANPSRLGTFTRGNMDASAPRTALLLQNNREDAFVILSYYHRRAHRESSEGSN